ncbi:DUF6314 family protein [Pseudochelatococcus sp. B33]
MAYADLLRGLAGRWRLVREVSAAPETFAASGGLMAHMAGHAVFSPEAAGLYRYLEEGELTMAGRAGETIAFSRGYVYGVWEQGLDIRFDDEERRPFQRVALKAADGGLEGEAQHFCAPDTYRSRYRFAMPLTFEIVHAVDGPRKGYVIHSCYSRMA